MIGLSIASEVVSAATAMAGLVLVYIGALASGYGSFEPQERRSVRNGYQVRAWVAFGCMIAAIASALLALLAKWIPSEGLGDASAVLLIACFLAGVWVAYDTAKEIK